MIGPPININDLPQALQLALVPAFLLTAIAGLLNVMTGRLARIIDRGRSLTEGVKPTEPRICASIEREIGSLETRRRLAGSAITSCTIAALLVCMIISALFLEVMINFPLSWLIGILFTGATWALVVGLAMFVREVRLSARTVRIPLGGTDF